MAYNPHIGMAGHKSAGSLYGGAFAPTRFGRTVKIGGRDTVNMKLVPAHPEAFRSLTMPVTAPAQWKRREKIALNKLLYALGYEINSVLIDVLGNSDLISEHGFYVLSAKPLTRMLRSVTNYKDAAFRDRAMLLNSMRVRVPKEDPRRIEIDFKNPPGVSRNGRGNKTLDAGHVAYMLEFGTSFVVTPRMRQYLIKAGIDAGIGPVKLKVGRRLIQRPRPFLRQSVDAGVKRFKDKFISQGGAARYLYDLYFSRSGSQEALVNANMIKGISHPVSPTGGA